MVYQFLSNWSLVLLFCLNAILCFSVLVVTITSPVLSVLSLICVFLFVGLLLLVLGADFLACIYILVYVGAVLVLFLWVVMTVPIKPKKLALLDLIWFFLIFLVSAFLIGDHILSGETFKFVLIDHTSPVFPFVVKFLFYSSCSFEFFFKRPGFSVAALDEFVTGCISFTVPPKFILLPKSSLLYYPTLIYSVAYGDILFSYPFDLNEFFSPFLLEKLLALKGVDYSHAIAILNTSGVTCYTPPLVKTVVAGQFVDGFFLDHCFAPVLGSSKLIWLNPMLLTGVWKSILPLTAKAACNNIIDINFHSKLFDGMLFFRDCESARAFRNALVFLLSESKTDFVSAYRMCGSVDAKRQLLMSLVKENLLIEEARQTYFPWRNPNWVSLLFNPNHSPLYLLAAALYSKYGFLLLVVALVLLAAMVGSVVALKPTISALQLSPHQQTPVRG